MAKSAIKKRGRQPQTRWMRTMDAIRSYRTCAHSLPNPAPASPPGLCPVPQSCHVYQSTHYIIYDRIFFRGSLHLSPTTPNAFARHIACSMRIRIFASAPSCSFSSGFSFFPGFRLLDTCVLLGDYLLHSRVGAISQILEAPCKLLVGRHPRSWERTAGNGATLS